PTRRSSDLRIPARRSCPRTARPSVTARERVNAILQRGGRGGGSCGGLTAAAWMTMMRAPEEAVEARCPTRAATGAVPKGRQRSQFQLGEVVNAVHVDTRRGVGRARAGSI